MFEPLVLAITTRLAHPLGDILDTPFKVRPAQLIGAAPPCQRLKGKQGHFEKTGLFCCLLTRDTGYQHIRLFAFGIMITKRAHQQIQFIRAQLIEQARLPSLSSRRHTDSTHGVTCIVHAVTVGTLTVLPGFTPVNGSQSDEKHMLWKRATQSRRT